MAPLNAGPAKKKAALSGAGRTPSVPGVTPVYPLKHIAQLGRRQGHGAALRGGPNEPPAVQALGVERHAQAVMPNDFHQVTAPPTKNVEIAGKGIPP